MLKGGHFGNKMTPLFSNSIPRCPVLICALIAFCVIPPEALAGGPNLCLWRHLFHVSACPACGSTRALAAFFHGQFAAAVAFNRTVVVTAPSLIALLGLDILRLTKRYLLKLKSA